MISDMAGLTPFIYIEYCRRFQVCRGSVPAEPACARTRRSEKSKTSARACATRASNASASNGSTRYPTSAERVTPRAAGSPAPARASGAAPVGVGSRGVGGGARAPDGAGEGAAGKAPVVARPKSGAKLGDSRETARGARNGDSRLVAAGGSPSLRCVARARRRDERTRRTSGVSGGASVARDAHRRFV